mmetsp:Transcript_5870/g.8966  ORF Transcript_5870/g.8966 Transcript_5870/m.8966 type:complete len:199 (+) Transcript_5870:3-599(+)
MTVAGTIENFPAVAYRNKLAAALKVPISSVNITLLAASVTVISTVTTPTETVANSAISTLNGYTADKSTASSVLGVSIVEIDTPSFALIVVDAPESEDEDVVFEIFGIQITRMMLFIAGGAAGTAVLLLLLSIALCCCRGKTVEESQTPIVKTSKNVRPPILAPRGSKCKVHHVEDLSEGYTNGNHFGARAGLHSAEV